MTYEEMQVFAGTFGLIFFIALFVIVLAYALWPGNKRKFEEAAHRPLKED